jgi:hypothetical protein
MDIKDNANSVQIISISFESYEFLSSFVAFMLFVSVMVFDFDIASSMVKMENATKWHETKTAEHTWKLM